jgi:hypothetical protein
VMAPAWLMHCEISILGPALVLLPCRDPSIALTGFSWDASDEQKARSSFALGRTDFGCFYDVQKIATQLGYSKFGLGRLCVLILGLDLPKPKRVRPLCLQRLPNMDNSSRGNLPCGRTVKSMNMLSTSVCFQGGKATWMRMIKIVPDPISQVFLR